MENAEEAVLTKKDVGERLRRALRSLSSLASAPAEQGMLDRLADLAVEGNAYAGEGALPGQFANWRRTRTGKKLAVVLHEAKLAVFKYWELVRTDETLGLTGLLENLEGYVRYGLEWYELAGNDVTGYYLPPKMGAEDEGCRGGH